jgi:hypothetical protein
VLLLVPLVVPVWSVVPPSFCEQPAKAIAANKTRIDFFIIDTLDF